MHKLESSHLEQLIHAQLGHCSSKNIFSQSNSDIEDLRKMDDRDCSFVLAFLQSLNTQLDIDAALLRLDGSLEMYFLHLHLFYKAYYERLFELEDFLKNNDLQKVCLQAQEIKQTSSNLGALRLSRLASEIERKAKQQTLDLSDDLLIEFHYEFAALIQTLSILENLSVVSPEHSQTRVGSEYLVAELLFVQTRIEQDYEMCLQHIQSLLETFSQEKEIRREISLLVNIWQQADKKRSASYLEALLSRLTTLQAD